MLVLALDTSGDSLSVSVMNDKKTVGKTYLQTKDFHSNIILNCVRNILADAGFEIENVELLAVCKGPGSFTGIRVGISFIKGIAFMLDKPFVGISSLRALAYPIKCFEDEIVYSCLYANKDEIYFNSYTHEEIKTRVFNESDCVIDFFNLKEKIKNEKKRIIFVGNVTGICYNNIMSVCTHKICKFYNTNVDSDYIGQAAYDDCLSGRNFGKTLEANYLKSSRAEKGRHGVIV